MQNTSGSNTTPVTNVNPGDQARPGTPGTGENMCPKCSGSGKRKDGSQCEHCGGTGKVVVGVGGA